MHILLISSQPKSHSANLGEDLMEALQRIGHEVDFVSHRWLDNSASLSSSERFWKRWQKKKNKLNSKILKLRRYLQGYPLVSCDDITMTNTDERHPLIATREVLSQIERKYDLVITLFWEGMTTSQTLKKLYAKLHCPILIYAVDMAPITGGCFYFMHCTNYQSGCGNCPIYGGMYENDQTRHNWLYKQHIFNSIPCYFLGNSWMLAHAQKSNLFAPERLKYALMPINENLFKPVDRDEARKSLNIGPEKQFVIFAGASVIQERRKGFAELRQSLKIFSDSLTSEEKSNIAIIFAGNSNNDLQSFFDIEVIQTGFLSTNQLIAAYSTADVFLSPSLGDAGPTMVNQSIMCGTPVVAFSTGVAIDIIESRVSGYVAKMKDVEDYARGIRYIYDIVGTNEYKELRENSRKIAEEKCSIRAVSAQIDTIIKGL